MAPFRHFLAALAPAVLLVAASGQVADPASVARRASAAMKGRDFETAERLFGQLSRTFPDEPGLALNLGLARYSLGKFDEALVDLNRFLRAQPDHGPAWLIVGISHQKLDRPHEAVGPLQRSVDLNPGNRIARLELADALLRSGRPESALTEFRRLQQQDSSDPRVWLGLGLSYTELSSRAAEALERAAPSSAYHRLLLGHSALARQRYRAAFGHYRAAQALDPEAPGTHEFVAEIYRQTGRADWASAELSKSRPRAPCEQRRLECGFEAGDLDQVLLESEGRVTPESLYWRARAFAGKARIAHERLMDLPPSSASYRLLASIEDLAGRSAGAVRAWRQAIRLAPDDVALRRNLLRSLSAAGLQEESIGEARALLQIHPESVAARYHAGRAMLELGRVDEAVPLLEGVAGLDARARVPLATAYLRSGRGSEAIPLLEAALGDAEDERLLFQLSRAYQSAGRTADARSALERRQRAMSARPRASVSNEITPP